MECRECKVKYERAVAGQAFTKYQCKRCGQLGYYHNTLIPNYCPSCSEEHYICERCGKDLLLEAILKLRDETNLYNVALEIGCSETSLRKYIEKGSLGDRDRKKVIKWYENVKE